MYVLAFGGGGAGRLTLVDEGDLPLAAAAADAEPGEFLAAAAAAAEPGVALGDRKSVV